MRPDGSVRWIRGHVFPIKDQFGHLLRVAGLAEGTTDRKQAEEAVTGPTPTGRGYWRRQHRQLGTGDADGVFEHGRSNYVNLWEPLGYAPPRSRPRGGLDAACHPDDRQRLWRPLQANSPGRTKNMSR